MMDGVKIMDDGTGTNRHHYQQADGSWKGCTLTSSCRECGKLAEQRKRAKA